MTYIGGVVRVFLPLLLAQYVLATVPSDPECSVTKGCFSECSGDACEFVVSWRVDGDFGLYTLTSDIGSTTAGWIGLGFSADQNMGGDSVSGCAYGADGRVLVFNAQTTGTVPPDLFQDDAVTLTDSSRQGSTLTCTIRRPTAASSDGKRFDITQPWYLLFARGTTPTTNNGAVQGVSYHGPDGRFVSSGKVKVTDTGSQGSEVIKFPLIKAHGCLMIIAWIYFASIGIILARYYKPVWVDLMCSQKVWFQIHRTCMVFAFLCTGVGFALIFAEVKGWSELVGEKEYLKGHPIMGVIVTSLAVINPLMALIRPHPGTPNRPIFNWAHWFVGTAAHILGIVTIFFGTQLGRADSPDYVIYILAAFVVWQVALELFLVAVSVYGGRKVTDGKSAPQKSVDVLKKFVLVLHLMVVSALTSVLVALVVVGKTGLAD
ncbi:putative ferric-chelate reductase 1 homolog [Aplysia californica]|uniref:Ferric-chelate reductase 1 homolog n=1 Tax=Aplysia californica TaxID=6500 RepID=A0ABM1A2H2_APLCA|nr:putative ferric-chelate reductase 1 homolog [Aplysia californica]